LEVSKRGCLLQVFSLLDNLLVSVGALFLVTEMLSNSSSFLAMTFAHENIYVQLFLYAFPTFILAEVITVVSGFLFQQLININKA